MKKTLVRVELLGESRRFLQNVVKVFLLIMTGYGEFLERSPKDCSKQRVRRAASSGKQRAWEVVTVKRKIAKVASKECMGFGFYLCNFSAQEQ